MYIFTLRAWGMVRARRGRVGVGVSDGEIYSIFCEGDDERRRACHTQYTRGIWICGTVLVGV